ncbi:MAG: peptide ABC transporter substrate-binding protein [Clostridia bacterium]|nr:peptide ABC transporter substrate-binding protein [Clostridia bacterium]
MKKFSKILCLLLAVMMCLSFVACADTGDGNDSNASAADNTTDTPASGDDSAAPSDSGDPADSSEPGDEDDEYTIKSREIYNAVLGEFYTTYAAAKEEANVSKKYALMAIAEAKLMESAVMLPTSTRGGNYAISRVAPYTVTSVLWGNDSDRFHQAIVATEPIKAADRTALKAKWKELAGTGTYEAYVKQFLADKGYTVKRTYNVTFTSDPVTWDAVATSRAADSEAIVNTYDGLVEYDIENQLKPALAESWTVSDDGLTYTFKIRQGLKWVDSQGREIAPLTAKDFVTGFHHMLDAKGGLEYLVQGIVANADEYVTGKITKFEDVGVKATDDTTLVYTLCAPTSYFMTMLSYNIFAPVCEEYYKSQGGKFGAEFDSSAADYKYGTTPENIAYCGPYCVSNFTSKNTIVFTKNEAYWNKANINIDTLTWLFNSGDDATKTFKDMVAGVLDGSGLNTSTLELAKAADAKYPFAEYSYVSGTDATSYMAFYNLNRAAFENVNDGAVKSAQTDDQKARTNAALQNVHFRRAISFAVDRGAYNAQSVGEELKLNSVRNSYTPGTFVKLAEEVTVDINGTATKFAAGTNYGAIMQAQIDADGVKIKVYDPNMDDGVGSSDGFDGWYNVENAVAELNVAIEELAKANITIDANNPIVLDLPYPSNSSTYTNKAQAYKKSLEASLGGKVIVNLTECKNYDEWYYTGYQTDFGYEANYDIYDLSGWGPDFGDPCTYLDTFLPEYAGYMAKCCGIF